ncbi:periplasmic sensor signal transduction histidine kinase [Rhodoferax ferrireducens T118]|uniref:histidine kinase n=1 Tax=Albidiferax ferrireducens (strain ATCC BAA-621 / DSM 15236 / T118) TaxID=338969 RepID=Q21UI7_ALBFT|nr:ATP-binding protein [Rhodoferax ferrireducens]ABD70566.1 periplasmic sensor signal transduction histidine kinase [Rhodoferax ferrireducens T118]WPC65703.1 ATP-binding protein [Rhodoferax ferrireducens]
MKPIALSAKPRRVKATFIWPFAIVLTFILAAFVATAYYLQVQVRDRALAARVAAVAKLVDQKLSKDTSLMQAVLRTMMGNRAIEAAFASRDRDALVREAGPLFETLRADHRITHLYFNGPDLVNVLRLHSPGQFGDLIDRETSIKARDQGIAVHGIELGPLGTLTLRLVVPWRSQDRLLGYLEIGEEVGYLVDEIRDSLSVDLLVMVDKDLILPQQWQHGLALFNRQGSWDRFGAQVLVAQTASQVPAALNDGVLASLRAGRTAVFEDGQRILHLAMLPMADAGGRRISDLVVMLDISGLQKTFQMSILAATLLSLAAGVGVLGSFYFALDRVERDYQRQHDLEHQLLRVGSEHQRMLQIEKLSALGTMVGEIAHQLNNPLVGVVNLAQLAKREADDPQRTRELLTEIHRAGADCHALIQSMLRFAKVSSCEIRPTSMAQVIEETVLLFRQTERRQLPVELRLPAQAVVLTVDPILIRHALFNLLLNAAQATVGDGAIVIALDRAVHPDSGAPGWRLSVTDQGRGIAPDILEKIFLPFFTTRRDGTGLGLPVVQHVALLHGGYVSASGQPGGGTQFAIWLPEDHKLWKDNTSDQLEHAA